MTQIQFPGEVQDALPGMEMEPAPRDILKEALDEFGIEADKPEQLIDVIQFVKRSLNPVIVTFALNPITFEPQAFSHTEFPIDSKFYRRLSQAMLQFSDGFTKISLEIAEKALEEERKKNVVPSTQKEE